MSHLDEGLLHAVADGEIAARDLADIQKHLADCQECRDRFAEARQLRDEALGMIESLDEGFPVSRTTPKRPRWRIPSAWAATIVAAVGLGYAAGKVGPRSGAPSSIPTGLALAPPPAMPSAVVTTTAAGNRDDPSEPRTANPPKRKVVAAPEDKEVVSQQLVAADSLQRSTPARNLASAPAPAALEKAAPAPAPAATSTDFKDVRRERASPPVPSVSAPRSVAEETDRGGAQSQGRRMLVVRADAPAVPNPTEQRPRTISAAAAITALGGSIRLVDGLTPARFEQRGEVIRVVYQTASGVLILEQWRAGELLAHQLIPPSDAPADSVRAWESRVR